jgi:hypothetical protein
MINSKMIFEKGEVKSVWFTLLTLLSGVYFGLLCRRIVCLRKKILPLKQRKLFLGMANLSNKKISDDHFNVIVQLFELEQELHKTLARARKTFARFKFLASQTNREIESVWTRKLRTS